MATAIFELHNGDVVTFENPHASKSELRAKVEAARNGSSTPSMILIPVKGAPITLDKADIKSVEYH